MNSIQKKNAIKFLLKESLTNFLSHAIIKTLQTPHLILKLILSTFVLVSTGFASYLVIQSIMEHLSFKVSTSSRTIYETPTHFPKITICNVNMLQTLYAFNLTTNGVYDGSDLSNEAKKLLAHSLNDTLITCRFNGKKCTHLDFSWSFDDFYGNCFSFNSGYDLNGIRQDLKESTVAGPEYGLKLEVYVNLYEKLFEKVVGMGALVRIANNSAHHTTFYSKDHGILVSPGHQTNIAIEREFKSILPRPYSNCDIDSLDSPQFISGLDIYNLIVGANYSYTQQLCFIQCYQKYILDKYNCTNPYYISLYTNVNACKYRVLEEIFIMSDDDLKSDFIKTNCMSMCPIECGQIIYKTTCSFMQLTGYPFIFELKERSKLKADFVQRVIDLSETRISIVKVNIFYESLSYILTSETPQMDGIKLFADIGGNLGFYLGVSVFSLFEVVEVGVEIFYILKQN